MIEVVAIEVKRINMQVYLISLTTKLSLHLFKLIIGCHVYKRWFQFELDKGGALAGKHLDRA